MLKSVKECPFQKAVMYVKGEGAVCQRWGGRAMYNAQVMSIESNLNHQPELFWWVYKAKVYTLTGREGIKHREHCL